MSGAVPGRFPGVREDDRVDARQVRRELRRSAARRARRREAKWLALLVLIALAFGALVSSVEFRLIRLEGEGMAPTLRGGDTLLVEKTGAAVPMGDGEVRPGDMVLVKVWLNGATHRVVRRVIGVGGDEIFVTMRGAVTVNGSRLEEPYATQREIDPRDDPGSGLLGNPFHPFETRPEPDDADAEVVFPLTVPDGKLFVLADDRNAAADSRSRAFALVDAANVEGTVRAVAWPLAHLRWLGGAPAWRLPWRREA